MSQNSCALRGLAAVCLNRQQNIDLILKDVVSQLKAERIVVAGYIQKQIEQSGKCCSTILVEDIATASLRCISQELGSGSRGCRLDTAAMAAAAGSLLAQIDNKTDLIVINRFGKGEAEGGGLRTVIEAAVIRNIPVLVGVRDTYIQDWISFAGDSFSTLPPNLDCVLQWCRKAHSNEIQVNFSTVSNRSTHSTSLI